MATSEQGRMGAIAGSGRAPRPLTRFMHLTLARLWWRRPSSAQEVAPEELSGEEQLSQLVQLIKQRREAGGLTLRELALETRITTPVIEAL